MVVSLASNQALHSLYIYTFTVSVKPEQKDLIIFTVTEILIQRD